MSLQAPLLPVSNSLPPTVQSQIIAAQSKTYPSDDAFKEEMRRQQLAASGQPLSLTNRDVLAEKRVQAEDVAQKVTPQKQTAQTTQNVEKSNDEYSFWDFVDLINPLQHLPIIGTIYRNVTEDQIKPEIQVAGSVLMGVATGSVLMSAASGLASVVFEEHTGEDPLTMIAGAILGDDEETIDLDRTGEEHVRFANTEYIDPEVPTEVYTPREIIQPILVAEAPVIQKAIQTVKQEETQTMAATLVEEQARLQKMTNPPSSDFIHQFMMQALDKYQVANRQTATSVQ